MIDVYNFSLSLLDLLLARVSRKAISRGIEPGSLLHGPDHWSGLPPHQQL